MRDFLIAVAITGACLGIIVAIAGGLSYLGKPMREEIASEKDLCKQVGGIYLNKERLCLKKDALHDLKEE